MTHNDVIRAVRHILNIRDEKLVEIIRLAGVEVPITEMKAYLKNEDEEGYKECGDNVMAPFLDGLVTYKRGPSDMAHATSPNSRITNNTTLKKLRVAFELKDVDLIELIEKSGNTISKTELSALFRKPDHRNYRVCGDQFLRNVLMGMSV